MSRCFLLGLALVHSIIVSSAHADKKCSQNCTDCSGTNFCQVSDASDCNNHLLNCSSHCLNIDVRNTICYASSISNGTNCDMTCDHCINQYQCNGAMKQIGLCDGGVIKCEDFKTCLGGDAKRQCSKVKNTGQCSNSCEKCGGRELCQWDQIPGCIDEHVNCADSCLDVEVKSALCYASSIPSIATCDESCGSCIQQYECNSVMEELNLCQNGTVHCVEQGICLDGEAKETCGVSRNEGQCPEECVSCFDRTDCMGQRSLERYGICSGNRLNCDAARCVANYAYNDICRLPASSFCSLRKEASAWVRLRCFFISFLGIFVPLGVFGAIWFCFWCGPDKV